MASEEEKLKIIYENTDTSAEEFKLEAIEIFDCGYNQALEDTFEKMKILSLKPRSWQKLYLYLEEELKKRGEDGK